MNIIKEWFYEIRYRLFVRKIKREIYRCIFPHLNGECDGGYPFFCHKTLLEHCRAIVPKPDKFVSSMEPLIQGMPKAYGMSFRYILYREVVMCAPDFLPEHRARMYKVFARGEQYPKSALRKVQDCRKQIGKLPQSRVHLN